MSLPVVVTPFMKLFYCDKSGPTGVLTCKFGRVPGIERPPVAPKLFE